MVAEAVITARNDLSELERLNAELEKFWAGHGLPDEMLLEITLVLEEVFVNVVSYAYTDQGPHEILVRLGYDGESVSLSVEDDGVAFDPLQAPEVDIDARIEERRIGGLGIHLVKNLMDEVSYERRENHNRLSMKKRVAAGA